MSRDCIELRGVSVHNLRNVDLDIPHGELVVFCGVSGSGKTSLALDTLYAEGQRRYIESFSAYTRQFLERLQKPAAESITGIPPAIAVTHKSTSTSSRATVGTATEIVDYLRIVYARLGRIYCPRCGRRIEKDTPETAAQRLVHLPDRLRYMVTFPQPLPSDRDMASVAQTLREDGFVRWIVGQRILSLEPSKLPPPAAGEDSSYVIVDRLISGTSSPSRVRESLETAMAKGDGQCSIFLPADNGAAHHLGLDEQEAALSESYVLDGQPWMRYGFSERLACDGCGVQLPRLEPRLFSFNSPLGACPACEGFGNVMDIDMELVVPNPSKSLRAGAVAPWNTPAYAHELEELLALADDYDLPVDVPFRELEPRHLRLLQDGVPERNFGGLSGFFKWLQRRKYKMHIRVFLSRWRSYRTCDSCRGTRLRPEALAARIGDKNLAEVCTLKVREAGEFFAGLSLTRHEAEIGSMLLDQVQTRLKYLEHVGLGYLTLDRTLRTLSGGEAQRVALTAALGSSLVNMLYVLDEPSIGLHPTDLSCLLATIQSLRDRGNTVVLVEHEPSLIRSAERVVELGPGPGNAGGTITFDGTVDQLSAADASLTGEYLSGRRGKVVNERRRPPSHGWIRLAGARGNNLRHVEVEIPLGVLCLITGVSGSGKSTLMEHTLYPALCRRKRKEAPKPYPFDDVFGDGQLDDVLLIDQSPIGRSPRSNPVTYIKAFDAIRNVFADTLAARTRNFKAGHFSFNVDGGRCEACKGDGTVQIDMQFLADVVMTCSECQGRRYRREVLEILYRGKNVAEVLEMTVREAFSFFRGQTKVQARLQNLIDVGLEYLRLGQAANTLSAGESQRLKLAAYLASPRRGRTLFLLDEPTTGLHFSDVIQLLDCFEALLDVGHSLVVVEHNLQMMQAADYIIDLGPGAAEEGGRVVAQGTPEEISHRPESATGRVLKPLLFSPAGEP